MRNVHMQYTQRWCCLYSQASDKALTDVIHKQTIKGTMRRYGSRSISMISLAVKS